MVARLTALYSLSCHSLFGGITQLRMVILVSDIHLTDTSERTTFPSEFFFKQLGSAIQRVTEDVTIVLLGDIFEILKSKEWIDAERRPWQPCDAKHVETVEKILNGIIAANQTFFDGMNEFINQHPFVTLKYVPGNHDRPINTEMGAAARAILQARLPLQKTDGEEFHLVYVNKPHKLVAKHGHEWDSSNRYEEYKGKTAAFGDAIVIDLILRLPLLVAEKLNISDPEDPLLSYLYEIDNLRPHTLRVIAQWLNRGLDDLKKINEKAPRAINETATELVKNLRDLALNVSFESFKLNRRKRVGTWFLINEITMRGFLRVAHRLPWGEGEPGTEIKEALDDFQYNFKDYEYLVSGHTHHPMAVPMSDIGARCRGFYINTGTWRRIRPVTQSFKVSTKQLPFAAWDEGSIAMIYSPQEQQKLKLPAFELQKLTRGT